jgi:hypothetical protein
MLPLRTLHSTRGTGATRNRVHVTELLIFGPPGRPAAPQPRQRPVAPSHRPPSPEKCACDAPSEPSNRKTQTPRKRRSKVARSAIQSTDHGPSPSAL